jgi:hypothetical protein
MMLGNIRGLGVHGLEGIIAKRRDRPYRSGRSPDWIKNPSAPAAMAISGQSAWR